MKKIFVIILILSLGLPVMAKKRQNEEIITPLTQLEKRQFQTKTYPVNEDMLAMKAILNVLQDEGFIVYNVNSLLGYIYGAKDFDISDPNIDISKEFGLTKSRLNYNGVKVATLEVSINVTKYGNQSRIRANFKRKLFNEYGNAQMIEDIDEAKYYDDFYKKVDSAIILQKQIAEKVKKEETPVSTPKTPKQSVKKGSSKTSPSEIKTEQQQIVPQQTDSEHIKTETQEVKKEESEINETAKPDIEADKIKKAKPDEISQPSEDVQTKHSEQNAPKSEPASTPEQILDLVPVDEEPVEIKTPKQQAKELKEMVKQAKLEAKQAQKEAKQAQNDAIKAEKQMQKEAKRQAKEMQEE